MHSEQTTQASAQSNLLYLPRLPVYDSLRTCFCLGDVSSLVVAFLMLSVSSFSALSRSTGRVGRWSSKRGLVVFCQHNNALHALVLSQLTLLRQTGTSMTEQSRAEAAASRSWQCEAGGALNALLGFGCSAWPGLPRLELVVR